MPCDACSCNHRRRRCACKRPAGARRGRRERMSTPSRGHEKSFCCAPCRPAAPRSGSRRGRRPLPQAPQESGGEAPRRSRGRRRNALSVAAHRRVLSAHENAPEGGHACRNAGVRRGLVLAPVPRGARTGRAAWTGGDRKLPARVESSTHRTRSRRRVEPPERIDLQVSGVVGCACMHLGICRRG